MTNLALPFFAVGNSPVVSTLLSLLTAPRFGFVLQTEKLFFKVPTPPHSYFIFPLHCSPFSPHNKSYHRRFPLYRIFILKLYFNSIYFRKSTIVRVLLFVKKKQVKN